MNRLLLLLIALLPCAFSASDVKSIVHWDTASAGCAMIAVPKGWRNLDRIQPAMLIYRQGDGLSLPTADETGAPVQIGLTVEKFPREDEGTEAIAKEIAKGASRNPDLKMIGQERIETIVLSDRTKATLITSEFIKATTRRSFYMKLVAKSDSGDVWVATGYIVAGRDSDWPKDKGQLASWLRAHVVSLTVTGKEVDRKPLEAAYVARFENQGLFPADLGAPSFDITGKWSGSWQESGQKSTEAFTMELVQTGAILKGTAIFMDSTRTRAVVEGEATGAKIRLVLTPPQPSLPETIWIGTVTNQTITGSWYLHAGGSTSTGSWSATAETNAAIGSPKD